MVRYAVWILASRKGYFVPAPLSLMQAARCRRDLPTPLTSRRAKSIYFSVYRTPTPLNVPQSSSVRSRQICRFIVDLVEGKDSSRVRNRRSPAFVDASVQEDRVRQLTRAESLSYDWASSGVMWPRVVPARDGTSRSIRLRCATAC